MRFIEDGPDIPDQLLFSQDEGNVVFFCGAGVSMAHAKLGSFKDLAQNVINTLGVTEDSKASRLFSTFNELNENPHSRGVLSADHIFSSLTRNFDHRDIDAAVSQSLNPGDEPDLTAHKTILKLATSQGGQTRLITTNFDLLFEAADKKLRSATRSNFPHVVFADNDWGIVHLHGRVTKDYSNPDYDGFVLSSSDFGEAYLAQGWARNFVKDVLEKFVAVFIGYSADDPPVRYLLEGLQHGDGKNHSIYAFQDANEEAVTQWDEKGVIPIVYNLDNNGSHASLWDTLDAWANRTKNPTRWKTRLLSKARRGPAKLSKHERGMVAHLVKSPSGARAFQKATPPLPSEWLCVFDRNIRLQQVEKDYFYPDEEIINPYQLYGLDNDPPPSDRNEEYSSERVSEAWDAFIPNDSDFESLSRNQLSSIRGMRSEGASSLPTRLDCLAGWVANVANERIAVWWAGKQVALHPGLMRQIRSIIEQRDKTIPSGIQEAWTALFELSEFYGRDEHQEYGFKAQMKTLGWSNFTVREYSKISAPFLKTGSMHRRTVPRNNRGKVRWRDLVSVDVEYPKGVYGIDIPEEYLPQIVAAYRKNIELAVNLERDFTVWIHDIFSIEPEEDEDGFNGSRNYDLSGYVLNFVELFRKLHIMDASLARKELDSWRDDDPVFVRLIVWASGLDGILKADEFTDRILSLSNRDFWPFRGERDLLFALRKRWAGLSETAKNRIEKRILKGPPKIRTHSKEEHTNYSATYILNRLHWLDNNDCELTFDLEKTTQKLKLSAPGWKQEFSSRAAESHDPKGGWVRTDTDWSKLKNIPIESVIEKAGRKKSTNLRELTEFDPFAGLSDERPIKAISALTLELTKGVFHSNYWDSFLSREARKNDKYRLKVLIAGRLTQIPNEDFRNILLTGSRWFEDHGPDLRTGNPTLYKEVWNKFIAVIEEFEEYSNSALVRQEGKEIDWVGEAINSAAGNLAELHMKDPLKNNLQTGEGFPKEWLIGVNQLFALPNDSHRFAMSIFSYNLAWFYAIDPKWTQENIIELIEDKNSPEDDKSAIWAGFMWGAKSPNQGLYTKLKPHFLSMAKENRISARRHNEVLSALLLAGWGSKDENKKRFISDQELRDVLLSTEDEFRNHTLWHLQMWSRNKERDWDKQVVYFLTHVWPKQKTIRTTKTSASLCEIALEQKGNFPAVSMQVSQLVSKIGDEHVHIPEISRAGRENDEENLAEKFPDDYLRLLFAILPLQPERWPYGTGTVLKTIEESNPELANDPQLIELKSRLNEL